jgi:hypothetical protein
MIKKVFLSICMLISLVSFAQEGTASPYSFFGIGVVKFKGTVENRSMAELSIFRDSIHMNLQNPALNTKLKYTTFTIGGTFSSTNFKTSSQDSKAQRTTIDYLAFALPAKKMVFTFGLMPYSSVGYSIRNLNSTNTRINQYQGKGGVNKAFVGFGYKISNSLSIGTDLQYNFGEISTTSIEAVEGIQFSSREKNLSNLNGFNINTGIAYQTKINKQVSLFSSVSYAPEAKLNLSNQRTFATIQYSSLGGENIVEESAAITQDSKLKLPSKFSVGIGFGDLKKWVVGTELTFQNNKNYSNRFNDINNVKFENSTKFTLGGYFVPKYNSYSSYFKRVTYRGGFRFENTGLVIKNESINDSAVTLGLGLPLRGTFSNVNVGFELGTKGTTKSNLVKENYANINISFSLNDQWFQKRKFD